MKNYLKKFMAGLLVLAMTVSLMDLGSISVNADVESSDYVTCITRKEGVAAEDSATTYTYNGYKPDLGNKFADASGHSMTYYESRSVYDSETDTWSEASAYQEIVVGFASSLAEYAVTESETGIYKYSWKAYCKSEGKLSEVSYTVILTVVDSEETTYDMTFYVGRDSLGANYNPVIKLYPTSGNDEETGYDTFEEGEEIVLEGGEMDASGQYRVYTASLKGGAYSYRAWGYDSETDDYTNFMGGMSVTVPMSSNVTQSGYKEDEVYIRTATVASKTKYDGTNYLDAEQYTTEVVCPYYNCTATPGTPYVVSGVTYYPYTLIAQGNACLYNYYSYPEKDVADTYNLMFGYGINATVKKGYTVNEWTASVATRITSAITVPEGAEAEVFFQMNNFRDMEIESYDQADNGDGTVTWYFYVPKLNGNYTYRVSKEGYVTKAGYMSLGSEASATISVKLDNQDVKSHSLDGLEKTVSTRDEANLIMNVSDTNAKNINIDQTFRLRAYRIWEIINSDAGNIMIEPDFNYEILSGEDCVFVEKVKDNKTNGKGNWIDITGKKEGTAVIAVTYNAIEIEGSGTHGGLFPAISPKRTGIVVINVGEKNSDISTVGVKNAYGNDWCWNYDTFYYVSPQTKGSLSITPEAQSGIESVAVAHVATDEELNSTMGEWVAAVKSEESYEIPLLEGNNIIKITSNAGGVEYQVIRAGGLNVNYENTSNKDEDIMPGDTVSISFEGLFRTIPKVSGIFNPVILNVKGTGSDQTELKGTISQYQVADSASFEVKIPEDIDFEEGKETTTYTISNGYINLAFMYAYADAWKFMYTLTDYGVGTNFNAVNVTGNHTTISEIHIPVCRKITYDVGFNVVDEDGNKIDNYTMTVTNPDENEVTDFSALGYGTYDYHIESAGYVVQDSSFKLGSATLSEEGKTTVTIVLVKADEDAWDGESISEPQQDSDGTYLIGTGAELAWFANEVNAGEGKTTNTFHAKLTADIDLAGYQWNPIGYYTSTSSYVYYGGEFDGDGYAINNLKMKKKTTTASAFYAGLFSYTNGAVIKNVTVNGDITVGSTASVSSAYTGGIAGYATNTTFENITANINIGIDRKNGNYWYIGGICGYAKETSSFTHVKNTGDVEGYTYVSGIAGYTEGSVAEAVNEGEISGYTYVGGIVGRFASAGAITNAVNQGEISATSYAAGITANMAKENGTITKAVNDGNVTAKNGYVAGIMATASVAVNVSDVMNTGDISGGSTGYTGSIAGQLTGAENTSFENCISLGKVTSPKSNYAGDIFGNIKLGNANGCIALNSLNKAMGTCGDSVMVNDCYTADTEAELLYFSATGKNFEGYSKTAIETVNNALSAYISKAKDKAKTVEERIGVLNEIQTDIDFEKIILQGEKVSVMVSAQAENRFIAAPYTITVNGYTAESFGFTDSVETGVSALDILVAEHIHIYGADFNMTTLEEYLVVSSGAYGTFVTKAFAGDAATFMYTVNGSMPNNGVLENGYYTSYTVDQAKVSDGQKVDFYFCQDAYYNDYISWFEKEEENIYTGKEVPLTLKGYSLAWYGSCEESVIRDNTVCLANAQLGIVDERTGEITPMEGAVTDENGCVSVVFEKEGTYVVTAYTEGEETPIFMPLFTVTVEPAQPIEVEGLVVTDVQNKTVKFTWNQNEEQIALGQVYHVYIDNELYCTYFGAASVIYEFDTEGVHQIKVTASLNGIETEGAGTEVLIEKEVMTSEEMTTEEITTTPAVTTEKETGASETAKAVDGTTKPAITTGAEKTTTKITVKKSKVKKAVKKKDAKKAKITLKKRKNVTGYQIKISTTKKFKKKNTITRKYKKNKFTIKGLKANKKYYIKARTYKKVSGKYYFSAWSKRKVIQMK